MNRIEKNQISSISKLSYLESVFVIGSAPTIKLLKKYKNLKGIKIGVGDVPWRAPKLGPFEFWVTANATYPLPWHELHQNHLIRSGSKLLLSSASVNSQVELPQILDQLESITKKLPIFFYDQRHFNGVFCNPTRNCCYFSKKFVRDQPIQEMLNNTLGKNSPAYSEGDSVALHALALAILLQARHIYVVGIEMPLLYRDYRYYRDLKIFSETFSQLVKRILKRYLPKYKNQIPAQSHSQKQFFQDFQKIVDVAVSQNIKVYSLSPSSPINYMNGVEFLDEGSNLYFKLQG